MAQEDYARLVASIGENGLLEPVAVWRGEVIDGRHRLRACAEAGVEPRFSQLDAATDPWNMSWPGTRRGGTWTTASGR